MQTKRFSDLGLSYDISGGGRYGMNEVTQNALRVLQGTRLQTISRMAEILCLHFGEFREIPSKRGGTRTATEWSLHIECAWRFTRGSRILVAERDLHYYADTDEPFDWQKDGVSRYDRVAASLKADFTATPHFVSAISCDHIGGFSLTLTPDLVIDVFPDCSLFDENEEFWRLFQPGDLSSHFTVPTQDTKDA